MKTPIIQIGVKGFGVFCVYFTPSDAILVDCVAIINLFFIK